MAISPDVLATALQEQRPGYIETFLSWHPLIEKIVLAGGIGRTTSGGPWTEFVVLTGGPGGVTTINFGSELITRGRSQNAKRGSEYAARMIYSFAVPAKDLAQANGKMDLAKILEKYPEQALADFHQRLCDQLAHGAGLQVGGFLTFNGQRTYETEGTARTGVFEFAAPASQSNTVHGLTQTTTPGWYNQYKDISSFATHGRRRLREAKQLAERQGKEVMGRIDLVFCDEGTYNNYIDDLDEKVRIISGNTGKVGDMSPQKIREGIAFLGSESTVMYLEDSIDVTEFTGVAADGVAYGINSKTWEMVSYGHDASKETKGYFDTIGPMRHPDQDAWLYDMVLHSAMFCKSRRHNFAVTGGASA